MVRLYSLSTLQLFSKSKVQKNANLFFNQAFAISSPGELCSSPLKYPDILFCFQLKIVFKDEGFSHFDTFLHFSGSLPHIHVIKFVFFSPVNMSYISLTLRPARRIQKGRGKFLPCLLISCPHTRPIVLEQGGTYTSVFFKAVPYLAILEPEGKEKLVIPILPLFRELIFSSSCIFWTNFDSPKKKKKKVCLKFCYLEN